jgi:magnesium chelatase family protein
MDPEKSCTCSASVVARSGTLWVKRISGPLLDRIDIHVDVPRVNYEKLSGQRLGEPSHAVRERVAAARQVQARRFKGTRLLTNADMGQRLMQVAMRQLHLSVRLPPRAQARPHDRRPGRRRGDSPRRTWPRRSSIDPGE